MQLKTKIKMRCSMISYGVIIMNVGQKYISLEQALSHPFANGRYDHKNANMHFIYGHESYKEWLEYLPVVNIVRCKDCTVPHNKMTGCPKLGGLVTNPEFSCGFGEVV